LSEDPFLEIDHVQLAMPSCGEETARRFFVEVLGMTEIAKPPELPKRGGCWFASGKVQVHLGVENDFRAGRRRTRRCAAVTMRRCWRGSELGGSRQSKRKTSQACAVAIFSIPLETESSWSPTERAKFR
jgi:catechol 2,3-dioxygenase-like lactoylglutathione lyase family enzyme